MHISSDRFGINQTTSLFAPDDPKARQGEASFSNPTSDPNNSTTAPAIGVPSSPLSAALSDALLKAQESSQYTTGATAKEDTTDETDTESDAATQFLEWMEMTPEERYYVLLLAQEGLTPEELAALPPEERKKIEDKIQDKMEKQSEENAGKAVTETAATEAATRSTTPTPQTRASAHSPTGDGFTSSLAKPREDEDNPYS